MSTEKGKREYTLEQKIAACDMVSMPFAALIAGGPYFALGKTKYVGKRFYVALAVFWTSYLYLRYDCQEDTMRRHREKLQREASALAAANFEADEIETALRRK
uniref:Uncharacterized protein n=1 Tax=Plectus sambesii TaxID=2011161 RepID=A0A914VFX4_9BILA